MANFNNNDEINMMIKSIERLANKDEIYIKMISEGQEIMKSEIEAGAKKHVRTGRMAKSLKCSKPQKDKYGDWVGRVKFTGSDGKYVTKEGKKYDITNWLKAFRIEYGTSTERPDPFVRTAIKNSRSKINKKWNETFNKEVKKIQ